MVQITPQMIQLLLECRIAQDEEAYEDVKRAFIEKHIVELKLEGLKAFLNEGPKKKIYDANTRIQKA